MVWDIFAAVFLPRTSYLFGILADLFWITVGLIIGVAGSWLGFACNKQGFHKIMYKAGDRYKRQHGVRPDLMTTFAGGLSAFVSGSAAAVCLALGFSTESRVEICVCVNVILGALVVYTQYSTNYDGKWIDD
jgi:hypothetical protein